jgi:hypothetical protein
MKIYLRQRPLKLLQWQAVQQLKKIENRKLENVLIVKLITWHARIM